MLGKQDAKLLNFCETFVFSSKMLVYITFVKKGMGKECDTLSSRVN